MKDISISDDVMDEPVDLDKIDSDPKEAAKLHALLEAEHYRRNIMSLDEFEAKYVKLFRHEVTATPTGEYKRLSQEYLYRIDPYYPVYVVRDKSSEVVSELLRKENIVYTLPAVLNRVGMVNNLGTDGLNIMLAFNKAGSEQMADPFNRKKAEYAKYLSMVLDAATDKNTLQMNKDRAKEQASAALKKSEEYKANAGIIDSHVEVQDIPEDMLADLETATVVSNEKLSTVEEEEYL